MPNWLWRVVIAVIVVLALFKGVPLFAEIVGFPIAGNVWELFRVVIAVAAVLYVLVGKTPPRPA